MKVERYISVYQKDTEKIVSEIRIDHLISFEKLKQVFRPYKNDPLLYMVYNITQSRAKKLQKIIEMKFDEDNFIYQLDCYQAQ